MTVSAYALISLSTTQNLLGLLTLTAPEQTTLEIQIDQASEMIENYCGRKFVGRQFTEYQDGRGRPELWTKQYPIIAVSALYNSADRTFDATSLVDATNFLIYEDEGRISLISDVFQMEQKNIKVVYSAGFTTVPNDIQGAAASVIKQLRGSSDGMQSENIMDYSYSRGTGPNGMPVNPVDSVAYVLNKYRRMDAVLP